MSDSQSTGELYTRALVAKLAQLRLENQRFKFEVERLRDNLAHANEQAHTFSAEAQVLRIEDVGLRAEVSRLADTLHGAREAAARIAERDYASRMEVERLRTAIHAAAAMLTQGEPAEELREIADRLAPMRPELAEVNRIIANTIEDAARILAQATPATP